MFMENTEEVRNERLLEARARNISHNVRCTEYGSQSIEDSEADVAILLRKLIRDEIRSGKKDKEIYKKLEQDFGETVLYTPKFDWQTAAIWLTPLTLTGGAGLIWAFKRYRRKNNVHIMALDLVRGVPHWLGPPVAALYVSEVSPDFVRGTYGSFTQIATCLGLMAALLIGIPAKNDLGWWRVCFWVSTIPAALLAILMEFSTESPHWLFKRGRLAQTEKELERLFGASHVKSAMTELSKSDRGDEGDAIKYSDLLHGRHFKVLFIGSVLYAFQQLSGITAVFYFSSTVFRSAGVSSDIGNICVGLVNISGSIVAMILMDRLGRKLLLLWSFLGMAVAMGFQVFAASDILSDFGNLYLSVGGMLLVVLTFSLGAGPVPGLLLSEILPGQIRAKAMAICMSVHWVVNFFVGLLFLNLLEMLGPQILYAIFGTFCLMAAFFVDKNVMETKGKSLQEIEMGLD